MTCGALSAKENQLMPLSKHVPKTILYIIGIMFTIRSIMAGWMRYAQHDSTIAKRIDTNLLKKGT